MNALEIKDLHTVRLGFQGEWVKEILDEVNTLLELDVESNLPLELRERLLQFLEAPSQLISLDCKSGFAGRTSECRILLKPSDGFLEFLLALRAWNRNCKVAV